jgi:hypothetical protein
MPDKAPITETRTPISRIAKTYAEAIKGYDVAIGKNPGQKENVGDMTTPSGEFKVDEICASNNWTHDFKNGKGEREGAYGPWFIFLETGWIGIGIHGT